MDNLISTITKETPLSRFLKKVFMRASQLKINYCVCGNYIDLPFHTTNDVDIWTENTKHFYDIVKTICKELNYKIYLKNKNSVGINLFIYIDGVHFPEIIHIDLLKECCWLSFLPLVPSKTIEINRKLFKDFYVANETVDAAMHLMYQLAQFGTIPPKYYKEITKELPDPAFWQIIQDGLGLKFSEKIKPLIRTGLWKDVENEFTQSKWKLRLYSLRKIKGTAIVSFYSFITSNISRLVSPSGLFIAFVGPDGCGKTTIQNNLQPFFRKGFTKGKINMFYWRPFLFPRIKVLFPGGKKAVLKKNIANDDPAERLELRKVALHKRINHCVKLFYYLLDYIFGRIKYQAAWSRGGIVCFDRYWGDLLVFPERFGLNVPTLLVRLLGKLVPQPDIVFYLHAEPEVLIARKLELPLGEMIDQTNQYKELCNRYDNYIQIDGNQLPEKVLADVVGICLEKMSNRHASGL